MHSFLPTAGLVFTVIVAASCRRTANRIPAVEMTKAPVGGGNVDTAWTELKATRYERRLGTFHHSVYCKCEGRGCHCCHTIQLWSFNFYKACVYVDYIKPNLEVRLKLAFFTVFKAVFPVEGKTVCGKLFGLDLCVQIYGVNMSGGKIQACAKITRPIPLDLGCFALHTRKDGKATLKIAVKKPSMRALGNN